MKIMSIEHVQLGMPPNEEDRARDFYEGVLEIPDVPKPDNLAIRGGVWFERDSLKVHLGVDSRFAAPKKAHAAFVVKDLQELIDRLLDAGYEVVDDEPLDGWRRIYTFDPFGNRIELMEPAI